MRKKFIAVYALMAVLALGSTTLTSCVDDNESASVTAIRNAKAQQLTALANYQQAQADAEKIISEAEAAIRNAEARWNEIQNSLEELELQKAQATIATEIEAAKAQAEAELLKQQAALEAAKAILIKAGDNTDAATQVRINNLMDHATAIMYGGYYVERVDEYGTEYTDYIAPINSIAGIGGLQSQLINKKAELIGAKYNLEDEKAVLADLLTDKNEDLAANEALLAEYEKYNNSAREDAEKAWREAIEASKAINATVEEANKVYLDEQGKVTAAITNINATEVGKFIASAVDPDAYIYDNYVLYTQYTEKDVTYQNPDPIKFTYDDGTAGRIYPSYSVKKRLLKAEDLALDIEEADLNIKAAQKGVENAKKNKEDALKETNTTYKALKDAVTAAEKAFNNNPQDVNIVGGTGEALQNAKEDLKNYEDGVENWVVSAEEVLAGKEAEKKKLTDFQTLMTGDQYKAYETVYAEYIDAVDAKDEALIAYNKTLHNQRVQNDLITSLKAYVDNAIDWEYLISQTNQAINDNKEDIEKLEAGLYDNGNGSEAALQDAITVIEEEIATLETKIAQKKAQYESVMSQVEALINDEDTPAEPETPAE